MTDEIPNPTAPDPEPNPTAPDPATPRPGRAVSSAETRPRRPDYRGEELDPERGPGLGCFWFQVIVLGFFIVLIPIGLELNWPFELLAFLLFVVIGLLLLTGQSVIFLLRLVAADRRSQGRRRPLASSTKTVGEIEDEMDPAAAAQPADAEAAVAVPAPAEPETAEPAEPRAAEPDAERAAEPAVEPEPPEPALEPAVADRVSPVGDTSGDVGGPAQESSTESRRAGRGRRRAGRSAAAEPAAAEPAAATTEPAAEPAAGEPAAASEPAQPEEPDPGVRQ